MRKIICILLAILILISLVSCDSGNIQDATDSSEITESPDIQENTKIPAEPYNGVFKTGYARTVITPTLPIDDFSRDEDFTRVADDTYATCVAVNDGKKTIILVSIDIVSLNVGVCENIRKRINQVTDIPVSNIIVSATHTHSTVPFETDGKWAINSYTKIANVAKEAVDDLADSEIYVGVGDTTGMGFVRRYINSDGTMSSVKPINSSIKSVSEPDNTVQVVRFVRNDKKDIVMANWQGHFADAVEKMPNSISSDINHYLRKGVEQSDDDVLMIYFAGAGGNINLNPPNRSYRKYKNHMEVGQALANVIVETANVTTMTKYEAGEIKVTNKNYKAEQKKDTEEILIAAKDRVANGTSTTIDSYIIDRNTSGTAKTLYLSAISFGDLAFVGAPYEMFDNNGIQIKEGSPFNMTFILTNAGGAFAYMPSYEACVEYGGYETEATYFATGVAEKCVEEYLKMLRDHKNK